MHLELRAFPCYFCVLAAEGHGGKLGAHGVGSLRLDPLCEALLVWAARDSSKEALGALLTE